MRSDALIVRAGPRSVELTLSDSSVWTQLLGRFPVPREGAIDRLRDAFADAAPLDAVTLSGCPSACLLPILWLRSMWLAPDAKVTLEWYRVEDPSASPGRQAAGRLACLLASEVLCADPARAMKWWGWDGPSTRWSDNALEAFDLLTNLVDCWGGAERYASPAAGWCEAARKAIATFQSLGMKRIVLYGAGTHTRAIGEALMDPGVEIVGIIDDDHRRHGQRLWGFPIISPAAALELKPDAIILSANSFEDQLWEKTAAHRAAGIRVARLYGGAEPAAA